MATLDLALRIKALVEGAEDLDKLKADVHALSVEAAKADATSAKAFDGLERELKEVEAAAQKATGATRKGLSDVDKEAVSLGSTISSLKGLLGTLIGAETLRQAISLADGYKELEARIKTAVGAQGDYNQATQDVIAIAQRTSSSLEATAQFYSRAAMAAQALGVSQSQIGDLAETVAKGLQLSGATAAESASATLQLSQALASGVLRGEEFNAVMEASPALMQALAEGLGVSIGALRGLAEQGKLSADLVARALLGQKDAIDKAYSGLPLTVGKAFQQLTNAFTLAVGQTDSALSATNTLASGLQVLANNASLVEAAIGAGLAAALAKGVQALAGFITQAIAAGTAATTSAAGVSVLSRSLTLLGGPAGILLAAAGAFATFALAGSSAKKETEGVKESVTDLIPKLKEITDAKLDAAILKQKDAFAAAKTEVEALTSRIAELETATHTTTVEYEGMSVQVAASATEAAAASQKLTMARAALDDATARMLEQERLLSQLQGEEAVRADQAASAAQKRAQALIQEGTAVQGSIAYYEQYREKAEALEKLKLEGIQSSIQSAQAYGNETEAIRLGLEAIDARLQAANQAAAIRAAELTLSRESLSLISQEIALTPQATESQLKRLQTAKDTVAAKEAEAAAATGVVSALAAEAESYKLINAEQLAAAQSGAELVTQSAMTEEAAASLAAAWQSAAAELQAMERFAARGGDSTERVAEAHRKAESAAAAYRAALESLDRQYDADIARAQRRMQIADAEIDIKLEQARSDEAAAKASGDESRARAASARVLELEAERIARRIVLKKEELGLMQRDLEVSRLKAAADKVITQEEQEQIALLEDSIRLKEIDIQKDQEAVKAKSAEVSLLDNQSQGLGRLAQKTAEVAAQSEKVAESEGRTNKEREKGGNLITDIVSGMYQLSKAAGDAFLGLHKDLRGASAQAAEFASELKHANEVIEHNKLAVGDMETGFAAFVDRSWQVTKAFYEQALAAQNMTDILSRGIKENTLDMASLEFATAAVQGGFDLLDQEQLSGLQSAIDAARSKVESLRDNLTSTLTSLQDELSRLKGDEAAIEAREFERKREELAALIDQATTMGDAQMRKEAEQAIKLLEDAHKIKMRNIKEEAEEADRQNPENRAARRRRGGGGGGGGTVTPLEREEMAQAPSAGTVINVTIEKVADGVLDVQDKATIEKLARQLNPVFETIKRRSA